MAAFTTNGEGWRVEDVADDSAYPVYVVWEPPRRPSARRFVGVAGGGEALEQMMEARALEAARRPDARLRAVRGRLGLVCGVPFEVVGVPPAPSRKPGRIHVDVSVELVDGRPAAVTAMRESRWRR